MNADPFFILAHAGGVALPAVINTPADASKEINVLFDRDLAQSSFGETVAENARPVAQVQSEAIGGMTITNAGASAGNTTLDIDDLWEDDDGNPVTDENDEVVYAAAQYQYVVKSKFKDAAGITQLELTEA